MWTLRPAGENDLGRVYDFLNSSFREQLLAEPLPERELFLEATRKALEEGMEHYSFLEQDEKLEGVIRIFVEQESCEIWGRQLRTLFYHCGRIAFEELGMQKLHWNSRKNNRAMMRTC